MMDRSWLLPLFLILVHTVTNVVIGNGQMLDQISNSSDPTTTSSMMTRVAPESSTIGSEHHHHPQQQKPLKFFSNYDKLNIWLKRFNARFQPLMNKCLHTKCQCLADLNHLAALANVTKLIENRTSTERLDLKERRKLATILLTNIIRLDGYQQIQAFRWYQCRLSAESICPSIKQIPEDYYPVNRVQLLSLLMAEVIQNNTYTSLSIYSYEFVQNLDELLRRLNRNLVSTPTVNKWFGRENLIADLDHINDPDPLVKVESLALLIVNRLVKGENIELFESRFLRNIIQHYPPETASMRNPTQPMVHMDRLGFARMLKDLHIGGLIENPENSHPEVTPEMDPSSKFLAQPHTHHVEVVPENETIRTERRIALNKALEDGECLDYKFYLNYLKQNPQLLTEQDIAQLAPIFLQQIVSKSCEHFDVGQLLDESNLDYSKQIIGLGGTYAIGCSILAVAAISASSLFGVVLIPFLKSRTYALMIDMLIGLAFGSMSGDALFHLIPSVLGLHEHKMDSNGNQLNHSDNHHHDEHEHQFLWEMLAVLISIYLLFLFEVISNSVAKLKNKTPHSPHNPDHQHHHRKVDHQGHHHTPIRPTDSDSTANTSSFKSSQTSIGIAENPYTIQNDNSKSILSIDSSNSESKTDLPLSTSTSKLMHNIGSPLCCGMTSLALILSISDSIHNLLDGVAIGISFSSSISKGLSTSIAVFCHEVPHEFGDFAVMLSTGMSIKRATWVNFLSALTSFIGLAIGLLLGTSEQANRWALAVCAGLFLYISLCDMLPELKEMTEPPFTFQWLLTFLFKNLGILLGYLCMILVALFEDKLNFA